MKRRLARVVPAVRADRDLHGIEIRDAESGIDRAQSHDAAHEKRRRHQKHRRQRHLGHDEQRSKTMRRVSMPVPASAALAQRFIRRTTHGVDRRRKAECQAGEGRRARAMSRATRDRSTRSTTRAAARTRRDEELQRHHGDDDSQSTARSPRAEDFRSAAVEADDRDSAPSACADRELARASCASREREMRDVRARDDEQQRDGATEQKNRAAKIHELGRRARASSRNPLPSMFLHTAARDDGIELCAPRRRTSCLSEREQSSELEARGIRHERQPHMRRAVAKLGQSHLARRDPDHDVRRVVEHECLSERVTCAEPNRSRASAFADDHDMWCRRRRISSGANARPATSGVPANVGKSDESWQRDLNSRRVSPASVTGCLLYGSNGLERVRVLPPRCRSSACAGDQHHAAAGRARHSVAMRSAPGYDNGLSTRLFNTLNIAVLAPIPARASAARRSSSPSRGRACGRRSGGLAGVRRSSVREPCGVVSGGRW